MKHRLRHQLESLRGRVRPRQAKTSKQFEGRTTIVGTDGRSHPLGSAPIPEPPLCPDGWTVGPPEFVIVGSEKSGTSRWMRLIREHPEVHVAKGLRELHFWDGFGQKTPDAADIERYNQYFPRPSGGITGEKTPLYMNFWWVPNCLATAAPNARIIAMLRDPVERYVSGRSWHEKFRPGGPDTTRADGKFTKEATERSMFRSLYALQLEWLFEAYPREQVLVLQFEACNQDTQGQLDRTFDFLGLPHFAPSQELMERRVNAAWLESVALPPERRELLQRLYRPEVLRLRALVPDLDLSLWPNFADLAS
jgi:Sulfotransferase domain